MAQGQMFWYFTKMAPTGYSLTVIRRYNKRFDDLLAVLPYCNEARFFDNENGFVEKAEYRNGELIIKSNSVPDWLKVLQQRLKMM